MHPVILHGHFYQPPREDPWTDAVPREANAAPHHDWNERIDAESYAPLARASAYERLSFDFGPTLLVWLERAAPDTYAAILGADRSSAERHGGHGNALASPYHHVILPLSDPRDRRTEIRWGIADFERRFGRRPDGMWLPETAVDLPTLGALRSEGVEFTVLAPHQIEPRPTDGRPVRVELPNGEPITVFTYDGPLSHGIAFGGLLGDADAWIAAIVDRADRDQLVATATDGETFGHHHRGSERTLADVLSALESRDDIALLNFGAALAASPVTATARLVEPGSWSCSHGFERWRGDCGCRMAPERTSQQRWRRPLRDALEWLAACLHERFEREARPLLGHPWAARDGYGAVVGAALEARRDFVLRFSADAGTDLGGEQLGRAIELLEMERDVLRMFTSCGWFFDDIAGLETAQILRYAAHAIQLSGAREALEDELVRRLAAAPGNTSEIPDAGVLYRERARSVEVAVTSDPYRDE